MTRNPWQPWGKAAWQSVFDALVVGLAFARICFAATGLAWAAFYLTGATLVANIITIGQTAVFGIAGTFLYRKGYEDRRARLLGIFFLLVASDYAHSLILLPLESDSTNFDWLVALGAGLRPEVYAALFFWLFVDEFPIVGRSLKLQHAIAWGRRVSLAAGTFFFLLGVFRVICRLASIETTGFLNRLGMLFFSFIYVILPLLVLALPAFYLKFRELRGEARSQASLFYYSSVFCLALPTFFIAFDIVQRKLRGIELVRPAIVLYMPNLLLATFCFITTYTVLAHRVLDVQNIARSALRHMLAKYSAILLGLVPFLFLVYFGWINRQSTVGELFSGSQAVVLVLASLLGIVAILYRQPLLDLVDRRFFRERYNSRRVLTELVEQVRGTRSVDELAKMVERGVDLALHLEKVSLLIEKPALGRYLDPLQQLRPLDLGSPLITLVAGSREPLAVDLDSPRSPFLSLPAEDRQWLADGKVEMIAPLGTLDGSLIGLLALGGKRSELPFLREDRELLAGVAASAGLVAELLRLKETLPPAAPAEPPADEAAAAPTPAADKAALECIACDRLYPPGTLECAQCHVDLERTNVPYIFRDLYRFDFRLGAGGMAVVYRAKDLKLGRPVAIKTLPQVTAEAAMRLRREARTAASVSHPGLAAIYGLETWQGVPMIITELLGGGTLADQLGRNPLAPLDALDMARTVAQALAKLHAVGILHRDIKPSNIGYTEDGDVKLLDFGIARIQHDFRQEKPDTESALAPDGRSRIVNTASVMLPRTKTGQLVGTVTYLSPEAARGEKPDPSVDLWALAVCVYESLTAENLFYGRNFEEVLGRIRDLKIPDVRQKAPACPEPLALFLRRELDLDRSRRAEDGLEMASRLGQVRTQILAS